MGFNAITSPASGITAPSLESGISLAATSTTVAFDLVNNDVANPTAIDLSFSSNYLEAASQHNGTAASPSYVLEAGETLPITLRRGSGAPSSGSEVCTVTALLADGSTATQSVTVHAAATVAGYVASLSAPTFELKFEGNTTNTGSDGTAFTTSNTSTSASTAVSGLTGKMLFTGSNHAYVRFSSTLDIAKVSWSTDRSYIYIINFPSQPDANKPLVTLQDTPHKNFKEFQTRTNSLRFKMDGTNIDTTAANAATTASSSNSDGARTMDRSTGLKLVVACYDAATTTMRARYKQAGDGAGHTIATKVCAASQTTSGTVGSNASALGMALSGRVDTSVEYLYFAVIDHEMTDSEFDSLATIIGL